MRVVLVLRQCRLVRTRSALGPLGGLAADMARGLELCPLGERDVIWQIDRISDEPIQAA